MAIAADLNREGEEEDNAGENSESESIESSMIGGDGPGDVDSSEYDEEAQWREEHIKLQEMFEKQRGNEAFHQNQQRTNTTHCISGSKVKLPYEMLINKLIDGLDTPDLVQKKELPVPNGMQQQPNPPTI